MAERRCADLTCGRPFEPGPNQGWWRLENTLVGPGPRRRERREFCTLMCVLRWGKAQFEAAVKAAAPTAPKGWRP